MRCIEIGISPLYVFTIEWLTLTWDVLKSKELNDYYKNIRRLTLTWDVLKFAQINLWRMRYHD